MGSSNVTSVKIWRAVNTPGGIAYQWRDRMMRAVADRAYDKSPVNNVLNAVHRGGVVGTYKRSWHTRRFSNQHGSGAVISNTADHAIFVEEGRSASGKFQAFSWTKTFGQIVQVRRFGPQPGVKLEWIGHETAARPGKHILAKALLYGTRRET